MPTERAEDEQTAVRTECFFFPLSCSDGLCKKQRQRRVQSRMRTGANNQAQQQPSARHNREVRPRDQQVCDNQKPASAQQQVSGRSGSEKGVQRRRQLDVSLKIAPGPFVLHHSRDVHYITRLQIWAFDTQRHPSSPFVFFFL